LFVVFGHAWRGVFGAGLLQSEALFHRVDSLIYAWHMPLFFFLSGLHFVALALREPPGAFAWARVMRLLWPLTLWTWIFFGFKLLAGSSANTPVTIADFPLVPLPPYEHLWFLWALFLIQIATLPVVLVGSGWSDPVARRAILGACAILLTVVMSVIYVSPEFFGLALVNAPFFLMGAALGRLTERRPTLFSVFGSIVCIIFLFYGVTQNWVALPVSLGLVLFLWVLIAALDTEKENASLALQILRYLGQVSMAIFLMHTIFSAAFRIGLVRLEVTSVSIHLFVAILAGVIGPLAVLWGAKRLRLRGFLGI